MSKLAILGGNKAVTIPLPHFVWPKITTDMKQAVLEQLDKSISIYDKSGVIDELENDFCRYYGMKHALLISSGTAALHSMFVAAGLGPGDEVICPAYTFYATVTPLFFTGAVPVLADCKADANIDPEDVHRKITKKTKAIIVTHMWGVPCEMDAIVKLAKKNNLLLFEDASHAHGATYGGQKVGTFGDASVFSLQGQKTVTGGEGGVLLTNSDEIYYRALLFGHYNKRCKQEIPKDHPLYKFAVTGMGLKLRSHPLAAVIAKKHLEALDNLIKQRAAFAAELAKELSKLKGLSMPIVDSKSIPTWYAFIMQYKPEELSGLPIEKFYAALQAEGCSELDRPGSTCPLNQHPLFQDVSTFFPAYKGKVRYSGDNFPFAKRFHENSLKLPVWNDPSERQIMEQYVEAFKKVVDNHKLLL